MSRSFDPIKFEVIRNALTAAIEAMLAASGHSAYSTNIKTRNDFSCVFFDRKLRTVAQAFNQPVHLGSTAVSVPRIIETYGVERLGPGDAILCNDPYLGSVHLNEILLVTPVFFRDALIGHLANLTHHVDVGSGIDRGLPGAVSGGDHHPAGQAGSLRQAGGGCLQSRPIPDPFLVGDCGGFPGSDRDQQRRRPPDP